jgi:hypothetical protein
VFFVIQTDLNILKITMIAGDASEGVAIRTPSPGSYDPTRGTGIKSLHQVMPALTPISNQARRILVVENRLNTIRRGRYLCGRSGPSDEKVPDMTGYDLKRLPGAPGISRNVKAVRVLWPRIIERKLV